MIEDDLKNWLKLKDAALSATDAVPDEHHHEICKSVIRQQAERIAELEAAVQNQKDIAMGQVRCVAAVEKIRREAEARIAELEADAVKLRQDKRMAEMTYMAFCGKCGRELVTMKEKTDDE